MRKRAKIGKMLGITIGGALVLGIGPKAQSAFDAPAAPRPQEDDKECSNATLKGTFAFTSTGFITAPSNLAGPFAIVGRQTFDGNGVLTAPATVSPTRTISPLTLPAPTTATLTCT